MSENHADFSDKNNPFYGKGYTRLGDKHPLFIHGKIKKRNSWFVWSDKEGKRIKCSRYVAEQYLGRKLVKGEVIHHINKDPLDDRPENLYVFLNQSEHMHHHMMKNPPILISNLT